ncbi:MAG: SRPBCC domain-containing protein [Paracoccaceae bacterium]|nr:SRPBCC domain-containing protein [Paracoccaceae bacterium]
MTDTALELELTCERFIAAPREALFDAWLDPAMLSKIMRPMPAVTITEAVADARVGGRFRVVMTADGKDMPHEGTYKTIDRPNELAFTWESAASTEPDSTVTLRFAEADGGTNVTLQHVRFPSEEIRDNHQKGWTHILEMLAEAA